MRAALTLAILAAPLAALAHAGPEGHAHPHGVEGLALALAVAAAAFMLMRHAR